MANGIIGFGDRVASGVVTVSTEVPPLIGVNLQHPHLYPKVWRSIANTASVTVDFLASTTIGCLALLGTNLTAAATVRVRLSSNSDMSAPTHDSGVVAGGVDSAITHLIYIMATPAAGRYLRLDLVDSSLTYLQAGRFWAGTKFQPTRNFAFGYSRSYLDSTTMDRTDSGQVWVDVGVVTREVRLTLQALTDSEINGTVGSLLRLGRGDDIMFVFDPASTNLGRDSIVGLITENLSVVHANLNINSLDLVIAERK